MFKVKSLPKERLETHLKQDAGHNSVYIHPAQVLEMFESGI